MCTLVADTIRGAIPFLEMAEKDYAALKMLTCQQDVLYLMASVYNTLGMREERDAASARHGSCVETACAWAMADVPQDMKEVWGIVSEIGAKLAAEA
jgi:anaphase-promoting complex subunit 5